MESKGISILFTLMFLAIVGIPAFGETIKFEVKFGREECWFKQPTSVCIGHDRAQSISIDLKDDVSRLPDVIVKSGEWFSQQKDYAGKPYLAKIRAVKRSSTKSDWFDYAFTYQILGQDFLILAMDDLVLKGRLAPDNLVYKIVRGPHVYVDQHHEGLRLEVKPVP